MLQNSFLSLGRENTFSNARMFDNLAKRRIISIPRPLIIIILVIDDDTNKNDVAGKRREASNKTEHKQV